MRAQELTSAVSAARISDQKLTEESRSRRLVEATEQVLAEALMILRTFDGPSATWSVSATERLAWSRTLDESIQRLMDVRSTLHALLYPSRSGHP